MSPGRETMADDPLALGPCCICGVDGPQVTVILQLNARSPLGRGWGCVVCGLPAIGALAVVCEACVAPYERGEQPDIEDALQWACRGVPGSEGRLPIAALRGEHGHDLRQHPEMPQAPPLEVLPTDTPCAASVEAGPGCRCSRCGQTIWAGVLAIRAWPASGDGQYRYHPTCVGARPTRASSA